MRRRILVAFATVSAMTGVLPLLPSGIAGDAAADRAGAAVATPSPAALEADFVGRINALRAAKGLGTLSVDGELTAASRSWAATMAGEGRIFHASDLSAGVSATWVKLGENVGRGGEIGSLFQAFVDSPGHYANLVDPKYTHVGVGVVMSGSTIFTTHRFMALAPPPPPPPPPPAPTVAPTTVPPTTVAPTTTAPPPTTAAPAPQSKFGELDRIRELIEAG